jgi:hypothetical protein
MPEIKAPAIKIKSDIQLFARAYFNIELTSYQMEIIAELGKNTLMMRTRRKAGYTTAYKVAMAYLSEGIKVGGRRRLPMHPLAPREKPQKGLTQTGRILAAIKRPSGAYNFELSRIALKYTSVISALRKDGHEIDAHRQYNKKGKPTDTWLYTCNE